MGAVVTLCALCLIFEVSEAASQITWSQKSAYGQEYPYKKQSAQDAHSMLGNLLLDMDDGDDEYDESDDYYEYAGTVLSFCTTSTFPGNSSRNRYINEKRCSL